MAKTPFSALIRTKDETPHVFERGADGPLRNLKVKPASCVSEKFLIVRSKVFQHGL
jgi:hypothetical protein